MFFWHLKDALFTSFHILFFIEEVLLQLDGEFHRYSSS